MKINLILKIIFILLLNLTITRFINLYAYFNQDNFRLSSNSELSYLDAESLEYIDNKDNLNTESLNTEQPQDQSKEQLNQDSLDKSNNTEETSKNIDDEVSAEDKYEDPLESYNRAMYKVNKQIDKYLIKPVAEFYNHMVPTPVKYMVNNFFENIQDVSVVINDFLQGEHYQVPKSFARLFLNSTFGIFGLIDVAGEIDLPKRVNDFGITLGKWSMPDSSYFIMPILGPSTIRDTVGSGLGMLTNVTFYISDDYIIYGSIISAIDKRASLLSLEKVIDTVSDDDEYTFVRNSYLDYRNTLINGETPNTKKETKEKELLEDIFSNEDEVLDSEELKDL